MVEHIWKNEFTPGYTRWIFHGEAHRTREEVLRQRVEDYDADAGVADMLNNYQVAQKPLHGQTKVSQLDAIGRVMVFKS
jgi:hypothetical protein